MAPPVPRLESVPESVSLTVRASDWGELAMGFFMDPHDLRAKLCAGGMACVGSCVLRLLGALAVSRGLSRSRPRCPGCGPIPGRFGPKSGQRRPSTRPNIGRVWPDLHHLMGDFGRAWPDSRAHSARESATLGRAQRVLCRVWEPVSALSDAFWPKRRHRSAPKPDPARRGASSTRTEASPRTLPRWRAKSSHVAGAAGSERNGHLERWCEPADCRRKFSRGPSRTTQGAPSSP